MRSQGQPRRGGRVHLIGFEHDGALLRELFTHDGVGTVVTRESLEHIREAKPDDIGALIALIEPMEAGRGILVHRPRELLEREIEHFSIIEHDGIIVGCAAFYSIRTIMPSSPAWRSAPSTAKGVTASS
jgi:amino-acid N-acetyltransferase